MLETISRLALSPSCDMDKLERLIALQERMEAKLALEAFNASFAQMQCEMPSVEKRTENTHTKKKYADLDDINDKVRPVMAKHGFGVSFKIQTHEKFVTVTGILMHRNGHREETSMDLPRDDGAGRSIVQAVGSTTTYGKRYVMCALLNITSGDDNDNDGYRDKSQEAAPTVTTLQAKQIEALIPKCSQRAQDAFRRLYPDIELIERAQFDTVLNQLTVSAQKNQTQEDAK
ncbi:MAG: ERF family protein [Pseudomonadota bacterium]